ncbi:MAG: type III-B CRISPR module RAMP protein Cmr6 [Dictyoglomus sp.]|nr:type III-B CRISPR module RAMP protein Cmr6 [Dictyoglomus sp.]MCX7942574.1 type III-B CRISPR module RAMP protein Cmr6 [Dictyoglomaceae bacterium]MDW8188812.1 type III-B CRISPR module RAMP protein Cmr6 [Dictyoglomus sp.]
MNINIKIEDKKTYEFYNPKDTVEILYREILKKGIWKLNIKNNKEEKKDWWYESKNDFEKNINLLFSKFIPKSSLRNEEKENKDKYLQFIISELAKLEEKLINFNFIKERNQELTKILERYGYTKLSFEAICSWRLIIGLGGTHPQETSMTLHHVYGIPYIPGSAIKGVTRHWAILKFADHSVKEENEDFSEVLEKISKGLEKGENFDLTVDGITFIDLIQIFGTQKEIGKVIFMDAYPISKINLKIDIMNSHYPQYYLGKEPPADWQNPVPIKFLTIEKTKFQFYLLSHNRNLLSCAEKLLKEALREHGLGAKTSLGYGTFDMI